MQKFLLLFLRINTKERSNVHSNFVFNNTVLWIDMKCKIRATLFKIV